MFHVKEKAGGREGERRRNTKEKETKNKNSDELLKKQKNKFEPSFTTLRILKRITGELI